MATLLKSLGVPQVFGRIFQHSHNVSAVPIRCLTKRKLPIPRKRTPSWLPRPNASRSKERLTTANQEFLREVVESQYNIPYSEIGATQMNNSPLKLDLIEPNVQWTNSSKRTGVIAKKIGIYPLWLADGSRVVATLLQVQDNHVIKYIPPEKWNPVMASHQRRRDITAKKIGCLVVGAESVDPQNLRKAYCGHFKDSGVMPKKILARFRITPDAALQPGTPLYASHFRAGDYVDIRAKTVDRGFQGVMRRWRFRGMPASHGVTKSHRRGGNIGSGGKKARVMPGTKMPGHMGNRWRILRGIKILRINTKYNVLWVHAPNIPGETNLSCYVYDTLLPLKKFNKKNPPPCFPTYIPAIHGEDPPEESYADDVHSFSAPTIMYGTE